MKSLGKTTDKRRLLLAWTVFTIFIIILTCLFPFTCDDWYGFENIRNRGRDTVLRMSIPEFFSSNDTGRVATWMLGIFFLTSRWTSILYRAVLFLGFLGGIWNLSGLSRYRVFGLSIAFFISFAVPNVLFRQCYSWYSGLVNYLPPLVLMLTYLILIKPLFSGEAIRDTWWKAIVSLVIGFVIQFFVETITIYCVYMSIFVLVWHLVRTKKVSWVTVAFCCAAVLGCILMFLRPEYRNIASTGEIGHTAPNSLGMLLYAFKMNYPAFTNYFIKDHTLLHVIISGCALFILFRGEPRKRSEAEQTSKVRTIVAIALVVVPLYFFAMASSFNEETRMCGILLAMTETLGSFYAGALLDILLCGLYCFAVLYVVIRYVANTFVRNFCIFCILSAALVCAPMMILQPAEYRCFFMTYIFWALAASSLLVLVLDTWLNTAMLQKTIAPVCYALSVGLCAFYLVLFGRCPTIENARITYTEAQMEQKTMSIVLPQYACSDYLHLPNDALEVYYYYNNPLEIKFSYIPFDQWVSQYGSENG